MLIKIYVKKSIIIYVFNTTITNKEKNNYSIRCMVIQFDLSKVMRVNTVRRFIFDVDKYI